MTLTMTVMMVMTTMMTSTLSMEEKPAGFIGSRISLTNANACYWQYLYLCDDRNDFESCAGLLQLPVGALRNSAVEYIDPRR